MLCYYSNIYILFEKIQFFPKSSILLLLLLISPSNTPTLFKNNQFSLSVAGRTFLQSLICQQNRSFFLKQKSFSTFSIFLFHFFFIIHIEKSFFDNVSSHRLRFCCHWRWKRYSSLLPLIMDFCL